MSSSDADIGSVVSIRGSIVDAHFPVRLPAIDTNQLPAFRAQWTSLFSALVRQYLFVSLYRTAAHSLASNASRLASMQGAERNIEERIDELNQNYHHQRQMTITEELLDIVSGFEALSNPFE